MSTALHVLIVEDTPDDADLIRRALRKAGSELIFDIAPTKAAYERALAQGGWDIILCDHNLPGFDSLEALRLLGQRHLDVPFIIVSGAIGEEVAVAAMKAGASDYVLKANLTRLLPAIERELKEARLRRDKRAADELATRLTAIMDATPDLVALLDAGGYLTYLNTAGRRLFGNWRVGTRCPDGWPSLERSMAQAAEYGQWSEESTLTTQDGRAVPISQVTLAHKTEDGKVAFYSIIARDISERAAAEASLREVDRRKDEFLATLSHELRNPLASLRHAVDIMALSQDLPPELEWVRSVYDNQVTHLTRLVNDLLDVSRLMQGKVTLQREPVELATVLDRAVETVRPLIENRKQRLHVSNSAEPVLIDGDLTRLAQVVSNLLSNAAKYSDSDGDLWLTGEATEDTVLIRVRDTGIGIPQDLLPHIFDLFTQGPGRPDKAPEGLGVGLTLVRSLVEMHGGRVEAESAGSGLGSTFTVTLPRMRSRARTEGMLPGKPQAIQGATPLRVLLLEDNEQVAIAMVALLRHLGHTVQYVTDGPAALALAASFQPQVALLDIGLPGMNGYDVARHLRLRFGKELTLVAITGYGLEEDRKRAVQAGFDVHLTKPVALATLRDLLKEPKAASRFEAQKSR